MAKKAVTAPPAYEPEALYDVVLNAVVSIGGMKLLPRDTHEIKGAALNNIVAENANAVASANPRD